MYRLLDAVDIQPSGDGGFNVGWTAAGEWLTYTIAVQQSGAYRLELRVATPAPCPPVAVSINGVPVGYFLIAATGDWQQYVTQTLQVPQIAVGQATLRISFGGDNAVVGPNVNWIRLTLATTPIPPEPDVPTALDPAFYDQVFVGGLVAPTDVAFAPDGRIFIAEKQGTIRIWKNGALRPAPVINLVDEAHNAGDKGLISITLHPFFTESNWLYMLYAVDPVYGQPDEGDFAPVLHRLVRYTMNGDVVDPGSRFVRRSLCIVYLNG